MYFYVCADYPVAVKVDGNLIGRLTDGNLLLPVCDLNDALVEVCSLTHGQAGLNFILNKDFVLCPPESVCVTDLDGGYLIKLNQIFRSEAFKVFAQEKTRRWACTVYSENGYKVTVETPTDFLIENLDFCVQDAKIYSTCNDNVVLVEFFGEEPVTHAYAVTDKIKRVLSLQAHLEDHKTDVVTKQDFCDIAGHQTTAVWRYDGEKMVCIDKKIGFRTEFNHANLPLEVLPYAFLEELLVGGNVDCYLTGNVLQNKGKLCAYLGKFIGVMPPPPFKDSDLIGIIKKRQNRIYYVNYLHFEFDNEKISNFSLV